MLKEAEESMKALKLGADEEIDTTTGQIKKKNVMVFDMQAQTEGNLDDLVGDHP